MQKNAEQRPKLSNANANQGKPELNPADIGAKNIAAELEQVKVERDQIKVRLDALQKDYAKVVAFVDEQNRAKMRRQLKELTTMTDVEIDALPSEEMLRIIESVKILKHPYASIKADSSDVTDGSTKLTVPSKFRFGPEGRK